MWSSLLYGNSTVISLLDLRLDSSLTVEWGISAFSLSLTLRLFCYIPRR